MSYICCLGIKQLSIRFTNPSPNTSSSSYRVYIGLSTQHDTMIDDNDIIMDTIADSGADIDPTVNVCVDHTSRT